jgi:hypothetical protein
MSIFKEDECVKEDSGQCLDLFADHILSRQVMLLVRCTTEYLALGSAQSNATDAEVMTAPSRTLPATGTTWCYSIGAYQPSKIALQSVSRGIAGDAIGGAEALARIEEVTDSNTPVNATRDGQRKLFVLPLAKGREWSDELTKNPTSHRGSDPGMLSPIAPFPNVMSSLLGKDLLALGHTTVHVTSWFRSIGELMKHAAEYLEKSMLKTMISTPLMYVP